MTPFGSPVIGGQKPSLRFQKRLKIHAKIAQPILLPLHNPLAEFLVNGLTSKYALLTYCVKF